MTVFFLIKVQNMVTLLQGPHATTFSEAIFYSLNYKYQKSNVYNQSHKFWFHKSQTAKQEAHTFLTESYSQRLWAELRGRLAIIGGGGSSTSRIPQGILQGGGPVPNSEVIDYSRRAGWEGSRLIEKAFTFEFMTVLVEQSTSLFDFLMYPTQ